MPSSPPPLHHDFISGNDAVRYYGDVGDVGGSRKASGYLPFKHTESLEKADGHIIPTGTC